MLFKSKVIILKVTASTISVLEVPPGKSEKIVRHDPVLWNVETIPVILKEIKKKYGKTIRLLIDDGCAYVMALYGLNNPSRDKVFEAIVGTIPEDIHSTEWDYEVVDSAIQIIAYHKRIREEMFASIRSAGFLIESTFPVSVAIAEQLNHKQLAIVVYKHESVDLVAIEGKMVISVHRIHVGSISENCAEFLSYLQEKYQKSFKKVVVSGVPLEECKIDGVQDIEYTTAPVEPAVGIVQKQPDQNVHTDTKNNHHLSAHVVVVVIVLFTTVTAGGGWLAMKRFQFTAGEERRPSPTPIVRIPTSTPPPVSPVASASFNRADYTIQVLNGSGQAGEATRLTDLLVTEGYSVIETGNADKQDYVETKLQFHPNVAEQARNDLDKLLLENYTEVIAETKIASDEADITIIIGASSP